MKELYVITLEETDFKTYNQKSVVTSTENEQFALKLVELLQERVGYVTQFEHKIFDIETKKVIENSNPNRVEKVFKQLKQDFAWE